MAATKVKRKSAKKQVPAASRRSAPRKVGGARSTDGVPPSDNEWFELRRSRIQGLGAFATKDIPKGTRIIEYTGEKISNAEADRRYDDDGMSRHHTFLFTLNTRTCVDAAVGGNAARFINHSCDPNCEAVIERGRIWIDAIRRIPAGTELVYDYQYEFDDEYTDEDLKWYRCACGSPKCRGTIVAPRKKSRK
jgi:SET domain-containing protein